MKGEEVKEILKKNGYALNEVAEIMGETPQNLQSMLRASDIKTGVLEKIANAINKSLYFFFEDESNRVGDNNTINGFATHHSTVNFNENKELIGLLKKRDEQMEELLRQQNKLIDIISNK